MGCTWDETKRRKNLEKHGIDFVRACRMFDGFVLENSRLDLEWRERRYCSYGKVEESHLFVVSVIRDGKRRIISARKAGGDEIKIYEAARIKIEEDA